MTGHLLCRNHHLIPKGPVYFIKVQGGGSLVIAFPALLALRRQLQQKFVLVCTPAVEVFARQLGIFDDFVVIRDHSVVSLVFSGFRAQLKSLKADTVIDLEVYSKLSRVFSVFTLARNRVGFYLGSTFLREHINTHLIYFNPRSGIFLFYEKIAGLFNAKIATPKECLNHLNSHLKAGANPLKKRALCVGTGCSELSKERMLDLDMWLQVFRERLLQLEVDKVYFVGSVADSKFSEATIKRLQPEFPGIEFSNQCGELPMDFSLLLMNQCTHYWGIDSGLLHFARLFNMNILSFWGPTAPHIQLKPMEGLVEESVYEKIACSPCIHVAEDLPCRGDNRCIKNLFGTSVAEGENFIPVCGPDGKVQIELQTGEMAIKRKPHFEKNL